MTLFRLPVLAFPFSPTSAAIAWDLRKFRAYKRDNAVGIISELNSRITWSLPLVYSVYFGKIYRFIYSEFPKGNTIVGKRRIQDFRAQYACN